MEQISFHDLPGAAQRRLVHGTLSGVKRFFSDPAQWEAYGNGARGSGYEQLAGVLS